MDTLQAFVEGPLFRLAFAFLVVGLVRRLVLILWPAWVAWRRARDRSIAWGNYFRELGMWLFPAGHIKRSRQVYSLVSYMFHIGLILVPFFLSDHVALWAAGTGIHLPALPNRIADGLSWLTILAVTVILLYRLFHPLLRLFSQKEDYAVLALIGFVFLSGVLAGSSWNPLPYEVMRLLHVLGGEALMIAIPFTKLSHCVFFPFSRLCADLGSKLARDVSYEYSFPMK